MAPPGNSPRCWLQQPVTTRFHTTSHFNDPRNYSGYGKYVRLRHDWPGGDTYVTWYGHLSKIKVKEASLCWWAGSWPRPAIPVSLSESTCI